MRKINECIKLEKEFLDGLKDDPHSCVEVIKTVHHLAVHPFHLSDINNSIKDILNERIAKYDKELNGILLGFQNVKLLQDIGTINFDSCFVHLDIAAEFFMFRPEVDNVLHGVVSKKSKDHVGCLVHRIFNVSLPRPEDDEQWMGKRAQVGQEIQFRIVFTNFDGRLPYIRAEFVAILSEDSGISTGEDSHHQMEPRVNTRTKFDSDSPEEDSPTAKVKRQLRFSERVTGTKTESNNVDSVGAERPEVTKKRKKRKRLDSESFVEELVPAEVVLSKKKKIEHDELEEIDVRHSAGTREKRKKKKYGKLEQKEEVERREIEGIFDKFDGKFKYREKEIEPEDSDINDARRTKKIKKKSKHKRDETSQEIEHDERKLRLVSSDDLPKNGKNSKAKHKDLTFSREIYSKSAILTREEKKSRRECNVGNSSQEEYNFIIPAEVMKTKKAKESKKWLENTSIDEERTKKLKSMKSVDNCHVNAPTDEKRKKGAKKHLESVDSQDLSLQELNLDKLLKERSPLKTKSPNDPKKHKKSLEDVNVSLPESKLYFNSPGDKERTRMSKKSKKLLGDDGVSVPEFNINFNEPTEEKKTNRMKTSTKLVDDKDGSLSELNLDELFKELSPVKMKSQNRTKKHKKSLDDMDVSLPELNLDFNTPGGEERTRQSKKDKKLLGNEGVSVPEFNINFNRASDEKKIKKKNNTKLLDEKGVTLPELNLDELFKEISPMKMKSPNRAKKRKRSLGDMDVSLPELNIDFNTPGDEERTRKSKKSEKSVEDDDISIPKLNLNFNAPTNDRKTKKSKKNRKSVDHEDFSLPELKLDASFKERSAVQMKSPNHAKKHKMDVSLPDFNLNFNTPVDEEKPSKSRKSKRSVGKDGVTVPEFNLNFSTPVGEKEIKKMKNSRKWVGDEDDGLFKERSPVKMNSPNYAKESKKLLKDVDVSFPELNSNFNTPANKKRIKNSKESKKSVDVSLSELNVHFNEDERKAKKVKRNEKSVEDDDDDISLPELNLDELFKEGSPVKMKSPHHALKVKSSTSHVVSWGDKFLHLPSDSDLEDIVSNCVKDVESKGRSRSDGVVGTSREAVKRSKKSKRESR